jgi:hypothetical protein
MNRRRQRFAASPAFVALFTFTACENLPGTRNQQSTTIGAVGGAVAGAAVAGEGNRLVGALIGGALGAAGGYLIGSRTDWLGTEDGEDRALNAVQTAQSDPATADDARRASTADLNADGFVTLDEVSAMEKAGLTDDQMLERLRATGQVFELNASQRNALIAQGVSPRVVSEMQQIRRDEKNRALSRV